MIYYKTKDDINLIRESCLLVSKTLAYIGTLIKPGITGEFLDQKAEEFIKDHGAKPGFKGYEGFPATLCISPNEYVVHGIPTKKEFIEKDIISIDCGVYSNEYFGDSAFTFALNGVDDETMKLLSVTKKSLHDAIEVTKVGNRIGDIGYAVQQLTEREHGYHVVRELVGHGIGKNLHEEPQVPNYGKRGSGGLMKDGLVIAIEPMINMGTRKITQDSDGWSIYARDRKPSAHYEHTVAVLKEGTQILSDNSIIEESVKNNENLQQVSINI